MAVHVLKNPGDIPRREAISRTVSDPNAPIPSNAQSANSHCRSEPDSERRLPRAIHASRSGEDAAGSATACIFPVVVMPSAAPSGDFPRLPGRVRTARFAGGWTNHGARNVGGPRELLRPEFGKLLHDAFGTVRGDVVTALETPVEITAGSDPAADRPRTALQPGGHEFDQSSQICGRHIAKIRQSFARVKRNMAKHGLSAIWARYCLL